MGKNSNNSAPHVPHSTPYVPHRTPCDPYPCNDHIFCDHNEQQRTQIPSTVLTYGSQTQITNEVGAEINFSEFQDEIGFPEFDLMKELQITAEHFHPEVFNEALDILDIECEQIETGRGFAEGDLDLFQTLIN